MELQLQAGEPRLSLSLATSGVFSNFFSSRLLMFSKSLCFRARTAVRCSSSPIIKPPLLSQRATISTSLRESLERKKKDKAQRNKESKQRRERVGFQESEEDLEAVDTRAFSQEEQNYFHKRERERQKRRELESKAWNISEEDWNLLSPKERNFWRRSAEQKRLTERKAALRVAKDLREQISTAKKMAEPEIIREQKGDAKEDVLFDTQFGVRTIDLNRPEKLHSLNGSMIRKIVPRLQEWQKSDMANVVVIRGTGPKAFCAGGDVAALAVDNETGLEGQQRSADYFALEYKLDHLIATYPKPYVAYMDGITMGGGVGLSIHAPFRIATERTVFAMPETTIGFFPDVGASFFLPRMNGAVGTYLALTSQRLKGVNTYYTGIATHYIHSTSLHSLTRRLGELRFKDYDSLEKRLSIIDATIEEFVTGLPHDEPMALQGEIRKAIDRCFGRTNVPDILAALSAEIRAGREETKKWAEHTLATIHQRSPTSVCVTLRQMQLGRNWSISETFQRENQIAAKFMAHPDFTEGVKALLIQKHGKPSWSPSTLEEAAKDPNLAEPFFIYDSTQQFKFLGSRQEWKEYPFKYGLPTENHIRDIVKAGGRDRSEIVQYFVRTSRGKQGVKQVVEEVLHRMTTKGEKGEAIWIGNPSELPIPHEGGRL